MKSLEEAIFSNLANEMTSPLQPKTLELPKS